MEHCHLKNGEMSSLLFLVVVNVNLYPMKEEEVPQEEDRSIEFVLMTRRGNKQHVNIIYTVMH
jgi:hypothetical protein